MTQPKRGREGCRHRIPRRQASGLGSRGARCDENLVQRIDARNLNIVQPRLRIVDEAAVVGDEERIRHRGDLLHVDVVAALSDNGQKAARIRRLDVGRHRQQLPRLQPLGVGSTQIPLFAAFLGSRTTNAPGISRTRCCGHVTGFTATPCTQYRQHAFESGHRLFP